jgi:outer membrane protein OmpA-like peptidoglycan-associated protein
MIKKIGLGIVGVVALLAALAYFVLPGLLLSQAEQKVAEITHRRLTLQKVEINPFALSLTVRGLSLYEPDGKTVFAAFDALQVKASLGSLLHFAPVIRELRLTHPNLHLVLLSPHHYNFDDLLQLALKPAPATAASGPARFAIHNIQIEEGALTLEDRPRGLTHEVTRLKLGIPFISTLSTHEEVFVEPVLSARIDGTDMQLKGKGLPFAAQPQASVHVDLEGVDLPRYLDYLPVPLPVDLSQGRLDAHLDAHYQTRAKEPATLGLDAQLRFNALKLSAAKNLPRLTLVLDSAVVDLQGALFNLGDQTLAVPKLSLSIPKARIEDRSLKRPSVTTLSDFMLTLRGLSTVPGKPGTADFVTQLNGTGRVHVAGALGLSPVLADLDVDVQKLDLMPLQPLLTRYTNLLLSRGKLSTQGKLKVERTADGNILSGYLGRLSLTNVTALERATASDLVRWKSLFLDGVDVRLSPFSLTIGQVALSDFFARVAINPDGRINLQDIVQSAPTEAGPSAVYPIRIGKVSLQGGGVHFSDNYVKPHYTADLKALGGVISGLSSAAASTATVDLRGQVNDAPLAIAGRINPLRGNLFLDIKASVSGMDMAPFSPYSGKYMGYDIEKGKLSFEVVYQVLDHALTAQNHLVLDQLTFGNKVEGPDATQLPVQLAIALLKDRNGTIDINLPVEGSLNDPQFSVGGIIFKMVINLITKAITAPFSLIASFFEGGASASFMAFDPGLSVIPTAGAAQLQSLAHALTERPALKLEITGRADRVTDAEGLRRAGIDQKVRALLIKQKIARGESVSPDAVEVPAADYPALLARVYRNENFPKPRNMIGFEKSLPVPEMEKLMMANTVVTDDDLAALASRRAEAVRDWLVHQGQVPRERLFIVGGAAGQAPAADQASPARVDFSLK